MDEIPFCQRNTRLWVSLLVGAGVLVLGFAIWLTATDAPMKPGGAVMQPASHGQQPLAGGGSGPVQPVAWNLGLGGSVPAAPRSGPPAAPPVQQTRTSFAGAADTIRPAVVNINAVRQATGVRVPVAGNAPRFLDPFDGVPDKVFGNVAYESVGSGVIVDPAGYVVTNNHLVEGATSIMVTRFNAGNQHLSASLVAVDAGNDLALLKLQGSGPYPAAAFANSSKAQVGDMVIAVGNPFGLGHTVTSGIISGRRRSLSINGVQYTGLLQTDAPINQGSSGGPLVNLQGKVVGINTAIYAPTGVFSGTGFAIPSNRVSAFVTRNMTRNGQAAAAAAPAAPAPAAPTPAPASLPLGLSGIDVTPPLAAKVGLPGPTGVFVTSVVAGSDADEAELTRGDVIGAVAGVPVRDRTGLAMITGGLLPGQKVPITVWRNGKVKTLKLKVTRRPLAWR